MRRLDPAASRKVRPRDGVGIGRNLLGRALGDDPAARLARARPEVDDPVGRADDGLVMLDDDERVAAVPQAPELPDEPLAVARMESRAGLVKDVEHAREPGADLRGEPDPLRLAPGERVGAPRGREVVEPEVAEAPEARDEPRRHTLRDRPARAFEGEPPDELEELAGGQSAGLGVRAPCDPHAARKFSQARPTALRARLIPLDAARSRADGAGAPRA